ncbi:MAG: diaminopimelate epimerase [Thermonemataceae bacterium]
MTLLSFHKYHGTGNDFIMIDNRETHYNLTQETIAAMCHRRFGIGADGLILLQDVAAYDFQMVYYNANGTEGSMCGNGGRCTVQFAKDLGLIDQQAHFLAVDGSHQASLKEGLIHLKMQNVKEIASCPDYFFVDTGSPHYVAWVDDLPQYDVFKEGKAIRNNEHFKEEGTNVNFIEKVDAHTLQVRTYERGVEDETYSCGTGVTAAALVYSLQDVPSPIHIQTKGGKLQVSFQQDSPHVFSEIYLIGPAQKVFEGTYNI